MEEIEIPKLDLLFKACKWLEPYFWYCRLLEEHVVQAGKIDGVSVPNFVLQSISFGQKRSTFTLPDMKAVISSIADIACVVVAAEDGNKPLRQISSQIEKIFSIEQKTHLLVSTKELQIATKQYEKLIPRLQKQQKKCWNLSKVAARRQAAMDNTRRNGEVSKKRYQHFLSAYEELLKQLTVFMELKNQGEAIIDQMTELSAVIKRIIVTAIEDRTKTTIQILTRVTQDADTRLPTQHILQSLQDIDANRLANHIFNCSAEIFFCPNIQDYRNYPGFTVGIPSSHLYQITYPIMERLRNRKPRRMDGYHLIRRSNEETLPGFFETKKDLKIKSKLSLMEGNIGYGWIKESRFSIRKTWGLFYIN